MYHDVHGICKHCCTVWNTSHSCCAEQRLLCFSYFPLSHLCTSSPCLPLTEPGSCDWPTAGLWSSSQDCSDPRRQTCRFAVPVHSTKARRQNAPRTHITGPCSPPEQALLPGPGQLAGPCRKGGSPWAQTSVSDRKSLSHPVGQCCGVYLHNLFTQFTFCAPAPLKRIWWEERLKKNLYYQCNHRRGSFQLPAIATYYIVLISASVQFLFFMDFVNYCSDYFILLMCSFLKLLCQYGWKIVYLTFL